MAYLRLTRDNKLSSDWANLSSDWANPVETPPFYGFPITTNLTSTLRRPEGRHPGAGTEPKGVPIPGLYAAGEMTGVFHHEYPPATSVLRSLTFGRIAGTNIARELAGAAVPA
jgi:hypothetical protein